MHVGRAEQVLSIVGERGSLVYDMAAATVTCMRAGNAALAEADECSERLKDGWIDGGVYASLLDAFTQANGRRSALQAKLPRL
jgi:hypothetical protein